MSDDMIMTTSHSTSDSTLTRLEWSALMTEHNLADGHARQGAPGQEFLARLPEIFRTADTSRQMDVQRAFEQVFYEAAGQPSVLRRSRGPLHHYSSSLSIEVVANHFRMEGVRVGLLHPTFDNIPDIIKRHGLPLIPVPEKVFADPASLECWDDFDALFLVAPNNPTGLDPTSADIERIALECRARGKCLVIDFSFRLFSEHLSGRDLYAFFEDNGVDYIGIEDVGKVWPMLDLKVGSLVSGPQRHDALRSITDDLLLNVSAFIFQLMAESGRSGVIEHARSRSVANRMVLTEALAGGPASVIHGGSTMSVAWILLPAGWNCIELCAWLQDRGIAVLPGAPFFWHDPSQGSRFIRIALMRSADEFETAVKALASALAEYATEGALGGSETKVTMNAIEEIVLEQAREILGNQNLDLSDGFFDAGGDSVTGMHFVGRVGRLLSLPIRTTLLFGNPVLADFAAGVTRVKQRLEDSTGPSA